MEWVIYSESADLAAECLARSSELDLSVEVCVEAEPMTAALQAAGPAAIVSMRDFDAATLVPLQSSHAPRALAVIGGSAGHRQIAEDLGIFTVDGIGSLFAGIAASAFKEPWSASARGLPVPDRHRLSELGGSSKTLFYEADGPGRVALFDGEMRRALGSTEHAALGLAALRRCDGVAIPAMPRVEALDRSQVLDVILGPPRALSDPASKAALAEYDIPLPEEVLCASASRAASEAARIGFPVRIVLASPDLRAWDHPDLVVDGVDNAARVREVFRQMASLAKSRAPGSRVLGVTVSATTAANALLRLRMRSLAPGICLTQLGFADPHGLAAADQASLLLPCRFEHLEARLERLRGHPLLLGDSLPVRRARVEELADVLLRIAAFVDDWRTEVKEVRIETLAMLLGGGAEIREACVVVSDAFARSLDTAL
ncbi:MAG: acetate--CoA ligase family protein [Polyangiales bacterium]